MIQRLSKNVTTFSAALRECKMLASNYSSLPSVPILCTTASTTRGAGRWNGVKKNYGNYKTSLVHTVRLITRISRAQLYHQQLGEERAWGSKLRQNTGQSTEASGRDSQTRESNPPAKQNE